MSKTYYDVSSEYMISQLVGMNTLLLLQTDAERTSYLNSLALNTTSTSTKITRLAQTRQNEYSARNKARRDEYEQFLAKLTAEDLEVLVG